MQPPPLCGEPGWLEECDYVQLRKILRENGAVAAHELAHITSKIELISLCHSYGILQQQRWRSGRRSSGRRSSGRRSSGRRSSNLRRSDRRRSNLRGAHGQHGRGLTVRHSA